MDSDSKNHAPKMIEMNLCQKNDEENAYFSTMDRRKIDKSVFFFDQMEFFLSFWLRK